MQHLLMDMGSTSKLSRVDIQWTLKQWHLDNKKKVILSDSFKLYKENNYLSFEHVQSRDTNVKQLKVFLLECEEHRAAVPKVFVLYENQEKRELVCNEKTDQESEYHRGACRFVYIFTIDDILLKKSDDNLVFYVELAYLTNRRETCFEVSHYCVTEKLQRLILDDYDRINQGHESLLQDNITFLIGNTKIKTHALILGAASLYFSAMFRHKDFKENKDRTVDLTNDNDVTPENFPIFLDIIYGRKNVQDVELKLLTQVCILADKYSVKEVLEACEFLLSRKITVENVNELLIFSEKYNCKFLKSKAVVYAKDNISAIKQMPNFENVYNNKPLLLELL